MTEGLVVPVWNYGRVDCAGLEWRKVWLCWSGMKERLVVLAWNDGSGSRDDVRRGRQV
jgi:hypothetical protein